MDLRDSRYWDRQLESGLPDSRLSYSNREKAMVVRGRMVLEKVFCANCGAEGGGVTPEFAAHVFYVCEPCALRLGPPPGCVEVQPETVIFNDVP
jgi:hypothetical protein